MNYKKYLILFLSIFILIACKKLPVDDIQKQVDKKIYYFLLLNKLAYNLSQLQSHRISLILLLILPLTLSFYLHHLIFFTIRFKIFIYIWCMSSYYNFFITNNIKYISDYSLLKGQR